MYDTILIGIDEIWLKSERVKKRLMEILAKDIKYRINYENLKIGRGRIFIYEYNEDWIEKLKKIFGIKTIYPSKRVEPNLEKIKEASLYFFKNFEGSFKVSVNRVNKKFPLNSYEIAKEVGSYILENFKNLKVDVKNPEKILYIEIHSDYAFLYDKVIYGFGGLPLGSEGKGLVLFSGGTDSSSAAILMGKRGLDLDFLFINIAGYSYLNFVFRVFQKLKEYFPYSKLFVWNLEIEKLMQVRKGYKQIIFKAIIYKIAESFAKNKYDVIITGESLAQVSSQTTEAIKVLDKLVSFPILRPLIGFNKDEIIEIA
ncbi:MAG: THUMP domain-containing protein, partial [Candidatus Aenigmatarchaeota archaeon]